MMFLIQSNSLCGEFCAVTGQTTSPDQPFLTRPSRQNGSRTDKQKGQAGISLPIYNLPVLRRHLVFFHGQRKARQPSTHLFVFSGSDAKTTKAQ
jgi:hypothetical protein